MSPELLAVLNTTATSVLITFIGGYLVGHKITAHEFQEKHYHTKWQTKYRAMVSR